MNTGTSIEWTDATWNPIRGCSRVSEGCRNCYAERIAGRFSGRGQRFEKYARLTTKDPHNVPYHGGTGAPRNGFRARWTGVVELVPEKLEEPLHWRKPRRIFVNSMSDLFHESLPDNAIAEVFAVMDSAPQHTFQVLTKRPERMLAFITEQQERWKKIHVAGPVDNVWLGVSVEDQATADVRVPLLLQTPAARRFVSYEPALGPVDFERFLSIYDRHGEPSGPRCNPDGSSALEWIIVGGESGPGAREFYAAWARSTVAQCRAAGVAVFVKQFGARPIERCTECYGSGESKAANTSGVCPECRGDGIIALKLHDSKGGDMSEWPEDLRVREFPA